MNEKVSLILFGISIGMMATNTAHVIVHRYQMEHRVCDYCKCKFKRSKSTSKYNIFCSLECEYFDMIDIMVKKGLSVRTAIESLSHEPRYSHFTSQSGGTN